MLTYRATLRPRSATLSPWQADTLFGHLCWLVRYEKGEDALKDFLAEFQETPPLLFSNGFPGDYLPRPQMPALAPQTTAAKKVQVQAMREAKVGRGIRWVSLEEFNAFRRGERVALEPRQSAIEYRTVLKNQINRLTFGTTPVEEEASGGNLYNADEMAFVDKSRLKRVGLDVSVYVKARDEEWANKARRWLARLALSGYGAKKAVGYGHFELKAWEPFSGFDESPSNANGFISLCNWVPKSGDPINGFYDTMVKYGKLGEELARSENPFKFPLIMLTAGSSFLADAPIKDWYGRLVEGVAPANKNVVQYGYAFAVPVRLVGEG